MVRLVDLEPRGVLDADIVIGGRTIRDTDRHGMGLSFLCPCCHKTRLAIFYANPIDGKPPSDDHRLWQRTGDTYETLTLAPSIDASQQGHWHGFIRDGDLT